MHEALERSTRGTELCRILKEKGIRHIAWLADSETKFLHEAIQDDPEITIIPVCKEGEAVAICVGLFLGGKRSALLVENQGIFECGNVIKWAKALDIPMVFLTGYLFYRNVDRRDNGVYINGMKDYTEGFYRAFDIPFVIIDADDEVELLAKACDEAFSSNKPVAVLLSSADNYLPGT